MKKSLFRFCLLFYIPFFSVACSHSEKLSGNEFLIEGRISDVEDGAVIRLLRMDGDVGMSIASDTLRNGRFIFKEEAVSDMERLIIMSFDEGFPSMPLDVWVMQGIKITINGKGKLIPTWEVKSSVANQKEENRYAKNSRNIIAEISRISIERDGMRAKMMTASGDDALAYRKAFDSLVLISISLDTDTRWREAMNQHDMTWVNIRDPKGYGGLAANYGVNGIPYYIIISPEGKVVDKWMGFDHGLITRKVSESVK